MRTMSEEDMRRTLNEWIRRFIEEPERFKREFRYVAEFLAAEREGREPEYGERGAAYQFQLLDEITAARSADVNERAS